MRATRSCYATMSCDGAMRSCYTAVLCDRAKRLCYAVAWCSARTLQACEQRTSVAYRIMVVDGVR